MLCVVQSMVRSVLFLTKFMRIFLSISTHDVIDFRWCMIGLFGAGRTYILCDQCQAFHCFRWNQISMMMASEGIEDPLSIDNVNDNYAMQPEFNSAPLATMEGEMDLETKK